MVNAIFKKANDTAVDLGAPPIQYGAPDLRYVFDVLDGTHATDRLQILNIEGFNRAFYVDWIVRKQPADNNTIEIINTRTGQIQFSGPQLYALLASMQASSDFLDGDTIIIKPDPVGFNYPNAYNAGSSQVQWSKSFTLYGYGAKIRGGTTTHKTAGAQNMRKDGGTMRIFGLTLDASEQGQADTRRLGVALGAGDTGTTPQSSAFLVHLEDFTLLNSFNRGVYVTSADDGSAETTVYVKNCYLDAGNLNADTNDLLSVSVSSNVIVDGCYLHSDETGTLAGNRVVCSNSYISSFGLSEGGAFSGQGEYVTFQNCVFDAAACGVRDFISIHAGNVLGKCKRATVRGCTFIKRGTAKPTIEIQPYDDSLPIGEVNISDCWMPSGRIAYVHQSGSGNTNFHSKVEQLNIENCYIANWENENRLVIIEDKDVDFLRMSNIKLPDAAWNADGGPIGVVTPNFSVNLGYVSIGDIGEIPSGSNNFIVQFNNNSTTGTVNSSAVFESPLRGGQQGMRLIGAGAGTRTRSFISNWGRATFSGNGSTTVFNIPHLLVRSPNLNQIHLTAGSAGANGNRHVTADATNVIVTYATAPASGTNNVVLYWSATAA